MKNIVDIQLCLIHTLLVITSSTLIRFLLIHLYLLAKITAENTNKTQEYSFWNVTTDFSLKFHLALTDNFLPPLTVLVSCEYTLSTLPLSLYSAVCQNGFHSQNIPKFQCSILPTTGLANTKLLRCFFFSYLKYLKFFRSKAPQLIFIKVLWLYILLFKYT